MIRFLFAAFMLAAPPPVMDQLCLRHADGDLVCLPEQPFERER